MQVEVSKKNITAQLSLKINKTCDAEPKKREKIMMKKNISLCALMILLAAGLYASDDSNEQRRFNYLINSDTSNTEILVKNIQENYKDIIDNPESSKGSVGAILIYNESILKSLSGAAQNLKEAEEDLDDTNNQEDSDQVKNLTIKYRQALMTNLKSAQEALSDGIAKLEAAKVAARNANEPNKVKLYEDVQNEISPLLGESVDVVENDRKITVQSKNIIGRAFQSLDSWIETPFLDGEAGEYFGGDGKDLRIVDWNANKYVINKKTNLKISIVVNKIDEAFTSLENATNGQYIKPVKDAVMRAVRTFSQESNIDNEVLKGIVDSAKIALLAPIKYAVQLTGYYAGTAVGGVAGAGAGFGAAINRTAKKMSGRNRDILASEADNVATKAAKIFAATTYTALGGIVNAARLTTYGALEGFVVGAESANYTTEKVTGDVWGLDKNPKLVARRAKAETDSNDDNSNHSLDESSIKTAPAVKSKSFFSLPSPLSSSKAGAMPQPLDNISIGSNGGENNGLSVPGNRQPLSPVLGATARSAATDASTSLTENRWVFFSPPPQGPALGQWRIDKWNESEEIKRQDFLADQDKAAAKQAVVEQSQKQQAQAAKAQVKGKSSWFSWSTVKPAAAKPVAQSTANR